MIHSLRESDALALPMHPIIDQLQHSDQTRKTAYVETLSAYLAHSQKPAPTCEQLHIHRNTLDYRLRRMEELTDLEETVNLTEFYVNKDDINKVLELDSRFHDIICRAGKNRPLRSMMSNFHNFLKMARHKSLNNPGRPTLMLEEHRKLLAAIASGDAELASHLAVDHTNRVFHNLQRLTDA